MDRDQDSRLAYAAAKFSEADDALCTGAGAIKERLRKAFRCIGPVQPDDLPESLRDRMRQLGEHRLLVLSPAKLGRMRIGRARDIAREFGEVSALVRAADERRSRRRD